jgi:hypothetical protein
MDEPRDKEQVEDLAVPEDEQQDVKGGAGGGAWFLRNSNSPGAANEGAEPHLKPGGTQGFQGGA